VRDWVAGEVVGVAGEETGRRRTATPQRRGRSVSRPARPRLGDEAPSARGGATSTCQPAPGIATSRAPASDRTERPPIRYVAHSHPRSEPFRRPPGDDEHERAAPMPSLRPADRPRNRTGSGAGRARASGLLQPRLSSARGSTRGPRTRALRPRAPGGAPHRPHARARRRRGHRAWRPALRQQPPANRAGAPCRAPPGRRWRGRGPAVGARRRCGDNGGTDRGTAGSAPGCVIRSAPSQPASARLCSRPLGACGDAALRTRE
jgi:hypothetical protein